MQVRDVRRTIGPGEALAVTLVMICAMAVLPAPGRIGYMGLFTLLAVTAYVCVWIFNWTPGPVRYSVRALLVVMTVVSIVLGVVAVFARSGLADYLWSQ